MSSTPLQPKILTVIVTFNAGTWIRTCIESTIDSTYSTDCIVIDNGSTDGTLNVLRTEYPGIKLIELNENIGFGRANNIGLTKALKDSYDYVFLLNQDAWLQTNALEVLVNFHRSNPEFGILSPIHLDRNGEKLDPKFGYNISLKSSSFRNDSFFNQLQPYYEIDFVNAALWLIPHETLKSIGGFNEFYFMYGEDGDYCARCLHHGLKIGVVTGARAQHARYNHHYKPRPFFQNILFRAREWHSWSYETFLNFDNGFVRSLIVSFERIWLRANQELFKKRYALAFAVILGWLRFLVSIPQASRDKRRFKSERKPHFIHNSSTSHMD